jgi:hypothetical protein
VEARRVVDDPPRLVAISLGANRVMPHPARGQWAERGQGVETPADVLDAAARFAVLRD